VEMVFTCVFTSLITNIIGLYVDLYHSNCNNVLAALGKWIFNHFMTDKVVWEFYSK